MGKQFIVADFDSDNLVRLCDTYEEAQRLFYKTSSEGKRCFIEDADQYFQRQYKDAKGKWHNRRWN